MLGMKKQYAVCQRSKFVESMENGVEKNVSVKKHIT